MQINSNHADLVHGDLTSLFSPQVNVAVAHELWLAHGWTPWSSYLNGSYLAFLR